MAVWYTSDLHFGHARINELCGRPFSSVDECDEIMIQRWNSVVRHTDVVYLLGDICLGDFAKSIERTKRLMGMKILIPGNHDRVHHRYKGSDAKKAEWRRMYDEAGFIITNEYLPRHLSGNGLEIDLCHFPFVGDSHESDRYVDERPADRGQILWHGHVHESWKQNGRQINVGVDVWDFYPVAEEELIEMSLSTA